MIAAILVILAFLHCADFLLKEMGFFKPEWSYVFEKDVLKPLGYKPVYYLCKNDIVCILKVQKKLNEVYLEHLSSNDWYMMQRDIETNKRLEEEYIDSLKKQTI